MFKNGYRRTGDAAAASSVGNKTAVIAAERNRPLDSAQAENSPDRALAGYQPTLTTLILNAIDSGGFSTGASIGALVTVLGMEIGLTQTARRSPAAHHKVIDDIAAALHRQVERPPDDAAIVDFRARRDARERGGA
jgi:hypothetical protein